MNTSLEVSFDFLSALASKGHHIIQAEIIDHGYRLFLPTEVFDGHLFSPTIKALECEWQHILNQPAVVANNRWLTCLIEQREVRQTDHICRLEAAIEALEQRRGRIQACSDQNSRQSHRVDQINSTIEQYRRLLDQARANQGAGSLQRLQSRLVSPG